MNLIPRSQSLFPIALMTLLVGLTLWLQRATEIKDNFSDSMLRHDPDYYVDNFTVRRFAPTGGLQSTLIAKKMIHYPDDDTTVITEPQMSFLKGPSPTHLSAKQGLLGPDGGEIVLVGNVRGVRSATTSDPEVVYHHQPPHSFSRMTKWRAPAQPLRSPRAPRSCAASEWKSTTRLRYSSC